MAGASAEGDDAATAAAEVVGGENDGGTCVESNVGRKVGDSSSSGDEGTEEGAGDVHNETCGCATDDDDDEAVEGEAKCKSDDARTTTAPSQNFVFAINANGTFCYSA